MNVTFKLSMEDARSMATRAETLATDFDTAILERSNAVRTILDRTTAEKRDLNADEKKAYDRFLGDQDELYKLRSLVARERADEAAAARGIIGTISGGRGSVNQTDRFGEAIRAGLLEVVTGRAAAVTVDPAEYRTITEAGDADVLVPTYLAQPALTLRPKTVVLSLPGIRVETVTSDRARFPRLGASTVTGVAEATALDEDSPDIDAVDVVMQKYGAIDYVSTELIEDSPSAALALVGENLIEATARKIDAGFLQGLGAQDMVGIRNTPGINTTSVAGTPADFDKFNDAIYEAELDNADPTAWVMHPRAWNTLSKIKTGISSDKTTLLEPNPQQRGRTLLGLPVFTSTQITLTEGATSAGSWAAVLDPSQLIVCERRPAMVEISRDFKFSEDLVSVRVTARYGLGVLNPEGVSILTDIRA
jgi:HK97 family phage major capsid protein